MTMNILRSCACNVHSKKLLNYIKQVRGYSDTKTPSPLKNLLDNSASFSEKTSVDPELEWATTPYTDILDEKPFKREAIDPRDTSVILFPGQGSQFVGMGKNLLKYPLAKELYEEANEILQFDLFKLCLEGPATELNKNCQVAVMVTSLAALERLKEERPSAIEKCASTAGFSLGEITALVFAGVFNFDQALKLVQIRAKAMEAASRDHPSGMITVMYGPDAKIGHAVLRAKQHCEEMEVNNPQCQVANYLYPHCKVIAGSEPALQYLEKNHKEFGIKRVQRVKVSGGFHTEIMHNAVDPFKQALQYCHVRPPAVRVISNVTAKAYKDPKHIKNLLPIQLVRPVRWEQTLHAMFSRKGQEYFPQIFTIGPGTSLRSILKQVNARAWDNCIQIDA